MALNDYRRKVGETAAFLRTRIANVPRTGVIAGTGLGAAVRGLRVAAVWDYTNIPHFPVATVQGHTGRLLFGDVAGRSVAVMQGRLHLYEGYSPAEVTFPVRVLQTMGVRRLLITNAAGGLNPAFRPGDLMLITDHINHTGENPLIGPNAADWGPRFPDMTRAYDPGLIALAQNAARDVGIMLRTGVYVGLKGPSLETRAEIRFLRTAGADAVGFSTVAEVIAAVHGGMHVLGIAIITNVNDPEQAVPATLEDILAVADAATPSLQKLLGAVLRQLDD